MNLALALPLGFGACFGTMILLRKNLKVGIVLGAFLGIFVAFASSLLGGTSVAAASDISWTQADVEANALNLTSTAVLDEFEVLYMPTILAQDHRTPMRMALATVLWTSTSNFNKCYERPSGKGQERAVLLDFPVANEWGSVTRFLFNAQKPMNSTFLADKPGHIPPGFTEIPCTDKIASKAYQFLKQVLDTLRNMGKLPFYPG